MDYENYAATSATNSDTRVSIGLEWDAMSDSSPVCRVSTVELGETSIRVAWDADGDSEYHYIWLRDNCRCLQCRHPETKERTFDLLGVPEDIRALSAETAADGSLHVIWENGGHTSTYEATWLLQHCYSRRRAGPSARVLWDAALVMPTFTHDDVMGDDAALLSYLRALRSHGVCMMHGVPVQERQALRVAERIGLPRRSNFGRHFDVASVPRPNSSAYTALHLHCHTDLPYYELPPGYQLLHCLRNDATGGESVLVDGFNVVQALRSMDPSAFEVLATVPLDFGYEDEETDARYRAPAIGLDGDGNIDELRFNTPVVGPLNVPADRMLEVYRAHRGLAALIRDPRFELRYRFAAGDLVAIDNRRVLHGRTAFDAASGPRHLQGCYVDRDGLFSRMRVLERATGRRETRRPLQLDRGPPARAKFASRRHPSGPGVMGDFTSWQ